MSLHSGLNAALIETLDKLLSPLRSFLIPFGYDAVWLLFRVPRKQRKETED